MNYPEYTLPFRLIPGLIASLLLGRRRSFQADARLCTGRLSPPLSIQGEENIPGSGPCVLTVNHYHRPGFGAWWISLAVSAVVPRELHWVMTAEWTFPGRWYDFLGKPVSRRVLKQAAKIYNFTSMPPMPPRPGDVADRSRSVRMVLKRIHQDPQSMLAISPEGADAPGGVLAWPPAGAGRFLLLLAKEGFPIVPVGCWEEQGSLCLRFGEAYRLADPGGEARERDHTAACSVMLAIARQLPLHLRGEFF